MKKALLVHTDDDMVVALQDLSAGEAISLGDESISLDTESISLLDDIPAKHKFVRRASAAGEKLKMYGLVVGQVVRDLKPGERLTTVNFRHATSAVSGQAGGGEWQSPDVSRWANVTFNGFHRADGRVGTRNYWIVVPLVFCQNRNVDVLRESLHDQLGYSRPHRFRSLTERLVERYQSGSEGQAIRDVVLAEEVLTPATRRLFPNVDGIKFLTHDGGCGGLYEDARTLCGLLAGYINHPNVAGATVLSLGCQKSQIATLEAELHQRNPNFNKPLYILEQQQEGTEDGMLDKALRYTFSGVADADKLRRDTAPLNQLTLGVECGGSDGFSGISANPAIGHCSDLIVALGGSVILSEFPELSGCESELVRRCTSPAIAKHFLEIMERYESRTTREGGGFDQNPSPGNVQDGLITDAMKSAGAARKGGSSPIVDVLDYPLPVTRSGLNLLCTPGGDVESTTAMAGSGANLQIFSTGLGTPTGNPVTPVLKTSSNTALAERMPDIIDVDAGTIVSASQSIEEMGQQMLEMIVRTASGEYLTKAEQLGQDDFIPWKRGISI